ncbi:MAG: MFS transporter [Chloroflexi bacterium]|nr:MFS transporter [Chloroflexota bacterium]
MDIPWWRKIAYASGALTTGLTYRAFTTFILFLYVDRLGLDPRAVGTVWAIYGFWNSLNDPLAGHWSDHTHTRWGRRIPWMVASLGPLLVVFYLLWNPPAALVAERGWGLLLYFAAAVMVFDLLWSIFALNWTAVFPEMFGDLRERATVNAWRYAFAILGLFVGIGLPPILAGADWSRRAFMAGVLTAVAAVFGVLTVLGARERPEFRDEAALPFWQALKATFGHPNFRIFLAVNLLVQFVFLMLNATAPFYTKYALGFVKPVTVAGMTLAPEMQTSAFLGLAFAVALLAMPAWAWFTRRVGSRTALQTALGLTAAVLLGLFWAHDFGSGMLMAGLMGVPLAGLLMLTDLLLADVVDEDELRSGVRREGMYFGINGLVIRLAFVAQGLIMAALLKWGGYHAPPPGSAYVPQPARAITAFRWMMAGLPALAALLGVALLRAYTLHGATLDDLKARLEVLHQQKRARAG